MIFARQMYLKAAAGQQDSLAGSGQSLFAVQDVPQDVRLITPGATDGYISIPSLATVGFPLPAGYVASTTLLYVLLRSEGVLRVQLASPAHATSIALINGSSTVAGCYSVVDNVTSIGVTNPTLAAVNVRYALVIMPVLTSAASFLYQNVTLGVNNGP